MIAYGALLIWPLATLLLLLLLPVRKAIIWAILGGYLLLPTTISFDYKGVPPLDKDSIPSIATFVLALALSRRGEFRWPRSPLVNGLMALFVVSPFFTGLTNQAPIIVGPLFIPGMDLYDSLSAATANFITLLPFVLGIGFLRDERSHRDLLLIYVVAALIYSVPILAEIRLSPMLLRRVYGIADTVYFVQQIRGGGFRAMVFLGHGLLIATFVAQAVLAATGLARTRSRVFGVPAALLALFLAVVLFLNKSVGAIGLTLLIAPALYLLPARRFVSVALVIAALVFAYPLLRSAQLVPTDQIGLVASKISSQRGSSFLFRTNNEERLLDHASEKPVLGWGTFGRNRVAIQTSWGSVNDVTVTDGTWIVIIGTYGWVGYIAMFGLLCYPFLYAFRNRRQGVSLASMALLAMMLLNLLDLLPNSSLRPVTWLIAGALSGMMAVRQARPSRNARPVAPHNAPRPAST